MPIHDGKRAFKPAGKGQARLFQLPGKFGHHGLQRFPIHQPHGADLLRQFGLQGFRQVRQRDGRAFGQHQPHDDCGLLRPGQPRNHHARRSRKTCGRYPRQCLCHAIP